MKPPPFDLAEPTTVDEAVALLDAAGDGRVLAGGQSLLQDLRWRRLAPSVLVDISTIDELAGVQVVGDEVRIGARVRHVDLERGIVPGPLGALLAEIAGWIAHPPVRSRGTFVGSLAWGHPAAEWNAAAAGLGGHVEIASVRGRRTLPVADLLLAPGPTTPGRTACGADELLTALVLPRLPEGTRTGIAEHRRTHASFAHVAVPAAVTVTDGVVVRAHLGLAGAAPTARRAHAAEAALLGTPGAAEDRARAAHAAAQVDADPVDQPQAAPDYTRHVVEVLVRRVLDRLLEETR